MLPSNCLQGVNGKWEASPQAPNHRSPNHRIRGKLSPRSCLPPEQKRTTNKNTRPGVFFQPGRFRRKPMPAACDQEVPHHDAADVLSLQARGREPEELREGMRGTPRSKLWLPLKGGSRGFLPKNLPVLLADQQERNHPRMLEQNLICEGLRPCNFLNSNWPNSCSVASCCEGPVPSSF